MGKTLGRLRRLPEIECFFPKTLSKAFFLLKKHKAAARVIAGGTDLLPKMKRREVAPKYLIDLRGIPSLNFIKYDRKKGLRIGAATTLSEILESPVISEHYPILIDAVSKMASSQIRNIATLGGNLCNGAPSADTAPPLIALTARVKLAGLRGKRTLLLEDFFEGPEKTVMNPFELVTEIQVPPSHPRESGTYLKHTRRGAMDLATVGVAVYLALDSKENACKDIKISLGAVAPTPMRAKKAEDFLIKKRFDDDLIEHAAEIASQEARPKLTSFRAPPEYKKEMVKVFTKRAIKRSLEKA